VLGGVDSVGQTWSMLLQRPGVVLCTVFCITVRAVQASRCVGQQVSSRIVRLLDHDMV
jgi:hypothetical protein